MATSSLGQLTVDLVANTAGFERGMTQAERALKSATKEADRQAQSLDKLIGQIDPTVAAYSRLDKMEQQLAAHRKAGRLPTEDYNEYLKKLNETRNALAATDKAVMANTRGLNANGLSAKQLAANLRGVPAQFTDIATSLAAGQNPLTVFLQQGGQLKDMFGGIGPAARALGGYVVGLINPFTLAAAAAATLALAYKQGSDEASAFQKALVLSGNAAGTSADQLASLSETVSQSVGTIGAAAAVLAQLAASGRISVESFDMIAIAALKMQEATGKAAEETVKDFEKIAKDPVKAIRELNETMNFLTTSTYAQIEALQRQGDVQGAVNLAEQTYADALTTRANKIVENLGYVEGAWLTVKNVAKDAWDAFLDVGRADTVEQKLKTLNERLQTIRDAEKTNSFFGNTAPSDDLRREQTEKEITDLLVQQEEIRRRAEAKAGIAAADRKGIAAVEALNKGLEETASKQDKLAKRYAEIDKQVTAAAARGVQYSEAQIAQLRKAAEEQFKPAAAPAAKAVREDAGQKLLDNLRQQAAALQMQSETSEKLGTQAQALARFQQEIADIKSKQIQTADQKALLASEDLITAQLKRNVALEQEVEARREILKTQEDYDRLTDLLDAKGSKALQQTKERLDILQRARDQGLVGGEELSRQQSQVIDMSTSDAPNFGGVDAAVGGPAGELMKLDDAQKKLEEWYEAQLDLLDEYRQQRSDLTAQWDEEELEKKRQYEEQLLALEQNRQLVQLSAAESTLGTLTDMAKTYAGEQSGIYKAMFAASKAFAIAQSLVAIQAGIAQAAANPWPANLAAMASVAAATASIIGNISAVGMAHDGIDSVPQDGTWLLQKGERVTTAQTSAKLDKTLDGIQGGAGGGVTVNVIESRDKAGTQEKRTDADGKQWVDLFVADIAGDGPASRSMQQAFGLQRQGR